MSRHVHVSRCMCVELQVCIAYHWYHGLPYCDSYCRELDSSLAFWAYVSARICLQVYLRRINSVHSIPSVPWIALLWFTVSVNRSKLTRNRVRLNGNPRSVRCETCTQSYIMPYRRHSNSANTKLGCHNVARLRNYVCQSKIIPFAHPNALPRLSTERLRTDLLRIFDHTESQDTATMKSLIHLFTILWNGIWEILSLASFEVYITFPHFEVNSLGTGWE